ncbi:MAG: FlgD immunoglobulin-like domain containing protein [Candidatus Stygibacter frigidus]|nr:FlgD immunoglobulin-like domain containing protein [Candidatus Stygibacter frigidus]
MAKHNTIYIFLCLLTVFGFAIQLDGQEMLANPSFEILDLGTNSFSGWDQMGEVGSTENACHGNLAASTSGINNGEWNVSAFWQQLDCEPDEQWGISGVVMNSSNSPLTSECAAIVNVEWRDINGELIDYDTFPVADASSPLDEYLSFDLLSFPAPEGTVSTRLLTGILQSPDDPLAQVYYDQITFYSTTPPTIDDVQWVDFPDGRTLEFADRIWWVKGTGWYGPGPNNFSHTPECVWKDDSDRLHVTIKNINNTWYSTEVVLEEVLGYGDYIFTTLGDLDQLDIHTVLGLFIWQYSTYYGNENIWWNPYNEIDVEISRWATPGNEVGQFVAQPWDWQCNLIRFPAEFEEGELTSHAFNWQPGVVEFRSWRGGPEDESPENMIFQWTYTGPHIPRPEQPRVHINLWQFAGSPAVDQEVIIDEFSFVSSNTALEPDELNIEDVAKQIFLFNNYPNPFNPETTIRFNLASQSDSNELSIYNLKGQRVYSKDLSSYPAGENQITWKGISANGSPVASGVYFYQLKSKGDICDTRRMLLLK